VFVGLAVAVVVLAVLVVAAGGPVRMGGPEHVSVPVPTARPVTVNPPAATARPCKGGFCLWHVTPSPIHLPAWPFVLAAVVAVLVVAARVRLRRRPRTVGARDEAGSDAVTSGEAPILDRVDHAVAEASVELTAGSRSSRDAVIAAWLRLEQGAADVGVPRRPAQTPTEFTRRVLDHATRGHEAAAVDELLHLYHRARFGRRPLPADAGERAVAAMGRIAAALRERQVDSERPRTP
jgi:hypothetical protein